MRETRNGLPSFNKNYWHSIKMSAKFSLTFSQFGITIVCIIKKTKESELHG